MRILVFRSLTAESKQKLKGELCGDDVLFSDQLSKDELKHAFRSAEIFLGSPAPSLFQEGAASLLFWQLDSAGFDQYRQLKLTVPVANMGSFFAINCAETVIAGVLALYRGIDTLVELKARKQWQKAELRKKLDRLSDKRVLILGTGTIGAAVKSILRGFGCELVTVARQNPEADLHSFEEVLSVLGSIDLVINTLPGTAENYVSSEFFEAMKVGSMYATVGRGSTTNEDALIAALKDKLSGAVLDVTAVEPLPPGSELWDLQNVILTQHTGGGSEGEEPGIVKQFINSVKSFRKGEEIRNRVDLSRGY